MSNKNNLWESYNNLLISNDISRIRKLIVRYELFKKTIDIPGNIAEFGVFKGAGYFYWMKLLSIFYPSPQKNIYGFDTFDQFSNNLKEYEKISAKAFVEEANFKGVNLQDLEKIKNFLGFKESKFIKGEIEDTFKNFLKKNKGIKFSLINMDLDTYSGTKVVLDQIAEYLSPNAILIFDEYGQSGWGETEAVDEFINKYNLKIECLYYSNKPTAFTKFQF